MTREQQFVIVVQTMALTRDRELGTALAGLVVAGACAQELPPPRDYDGGSEIFDLASRYVDWLYSHRAHKAYRPAWAQDLFTDQESLQP
jgi:hypothetical protein